MDKQTAGMIRQLINEPEEEAAAISPHPMITRTVLYRAFYSPELIPHYWPAIITHVFSDTCVNLYVFADGSYGLPPVGDRPTSVVRGDGIDMWSWPLRG